MIQADRSMLASAVGGTSLGIGGAPIGAVIAFSIAGAAVGAWMDQMGMTPNRQRSTEQFAANFAVMLFSWWLTTQSIPPPVRLPAGRVRRGA